MVHQHNAILTVIHHVVLMLLDGVVAVMSIAHVTTVKTSGNVSKERVIIYRQGAKIFSSKKGPNTFFRERKKRGKDFSFKK